MDCAGYQWVIRITQPRTEDINTWHYRSGKTLTISILIKCVKQSDLSVILSKPAKKNISKQETPQNLQWKFRLQTELTTVLEELCEKTATGRESAGASSPNSLTDA